MSSNHLKIGTRQVVRLDTVSVDLPGAPTFLRVVATSDRVLGFVDVAMVDETEASVRQLFVRHGERGKGVGSKLMRCAESVAIGQGRARLGLTIDEPESCAALIAWYQRRDYTIEPDRKGRFVMCKRLER